MLRMSKATAVPNPMGKEEEGKGEPQMRNTSLRMASLAQLVEHALRKREVVDSIPTEGFQ